jgi:hypothetical protein
MSIGSSEPASLSAALIAGVVSGVVGGVILLTLAMMVAIFCYVRMKASKMMENRNCIMMEVMRIWHSKMKKLKICKVPYT